MEIEDDTAMRRGLVSRWLTPGQDSEKALQNFTVLTFLQRSFV